MSSSLRRSRSSPDGNTGGMRTPDANAAGRLGAAAVALLGAASGVGLELALGAAGWSFVAWLAPVPLLLAIRRARSVGLAYAAAFSTGCVFWALHIRWTGPIPGVNAANYGVAIALLGALFGLVGPLSWPARWAPTGTRWAALAAAWALAEYVRLHVGFASTPWGMLAYSQVAQTPAEQLAAFTGLYGVSFLVVSGAAAISDVMHAARMRRWPLESARWEVVAPVTVIAAAMLWGSIRVETAVPGAAKLRIGLVQGGTYERGVDPPTRRREILEGYREQTRRAAEAGVDLVAWPASSVPGAIPFDTGLVRFLGTLSHEIATPLLVGSSGQAKSRPSQRDRPTANSAFLIDSRGEIVGQYDKIQLLPFNEYQPLRGVLRWPGWVAGDAIDARTGRSSIGVRAERRAIWRPDLLGEPLSGRVSGHDLPGAGLRREPHQRGLHARSPRPSSNVDDESPARHRERNSRDSNCDDGSDRRHRSLRTTERRGFRRVRKHPGRRRLPRSGGCPRIVAQLLRPIRGCIRRRVCARRCCTHHRTGASKARGRDHVKATGGRRLQQCVLGGLVLFAIVLQGAYLYNAIRWIDAPDRGWIAMVQLGPKVVRGTTPRPAGGPA